MGGVRVGGPSDASPTGRADEEEEEEEEEDENDDEEADEDLRCGAELRRPCLPAFLLFYFFSLAMRSFFFSFFPSFFFFAELHRKSPPL